MEKTKKFLNVCIGLAVVLCSISLLIFSARQNTAKAQVGATLPNGVIVAGVVMKGAGFGAYYYVIGYNPKDAQVSVLGKINAKDLND